MTLESRLKAEARRLGFALAGIAPATDADGFAHFGDWLDAGYHGEMHYLEKHREPRRHPRAILESVRSVLMLGLEYGTGETDDVPEGAGRIARYARGPDYHRFAWDKVNDLAAWLKREVPGSEAHGACDSAPLLERDFARRAGLGWTGKNTMLIHPKRGSFFFLVALLTSLELDADPPFAADHCGTCTACLDACPTQAFVQPGVLDARKCISYLTIELRAPMPAELCPQVGDWLFGCDICQEVCPWNRFAGREALTFPATNELATLDPVELLALSPAEFREKFRHTSLFRNRRAGLLRNAAIVLGNVGTAECLPALALAMLEPNEMIREAAAWAIEQVQRRLATPIRRRADHPAV